MSTYNPNPNPIPFSLLSSSRSSTFPSSQITQSALESLEFDTDTDDDDANVPTQSTFRLSAQPQHNHIRSADTDLLTHTHALTESQELLPSQPLSNPTTPATRQTRPQTQTQTQYQTHSAPQTPTSSSSRTNINMSNPYHHVRSPYIPVIPNNNLYPGSGHNNNKDNSSPLGPANPYGSGQSVDLGPRNGGIPKNGAQGGKKPLHRRAGPGSGSASGMYSQYQSPSSSAHGSTATLKSPSGSLNQDGYGGTPHKRRNVAEVENKENEEEVEMDDFDPQAPVDIFDDKVKLQDEWDNLQEGVEPFLQEFATKVYTNACDIILATSYCFRRLENQNKDSFIKGIEDIEAEQEKHAEARKTITDFAQEIQKVAQMLQKYQGGWAGSAGASAKTETGGEA